MSRAGLTMSVFLIFAGLIALIAFGIAQVFPHKGMPFVAMVSGVWTVFAVSRARKMAQ